MNDAKAMADQFSFWKRNSSSHLLSQNAKTKNELRDLVRQDFCPHIMRAGPSLKVISIFIACHAVQREDELYFIPGGADFDLNNLEDLQLALQYHCYTLSELVESVIEAVIERDCREKVVCAFICDVCRDLDFSVCAESLRKCKKTLVDKDNKATIASRCDFMLVFSASQDQCAKDAHESTTGHSPYTKAFLDAIHEGMCNENVSLTLQEMHSHASAAVHGSGMRCGLGSM